MIRRIVTLLTLMLLLVRASAQEGKPVVCIGEFKNNSNKNIKLLKTLRGKVIEGIDKTNRLSLVDIYTMGEMPTAKNELVKTLGEKGIQYLIECEMNSVTGNKKRYYDYLKKDSADSYNAEVKFSLTMIETETGITIASNNYTSSSSSYIFSKPGSIEEAVQKAMEGVSSKMNGFVSENFKIKALVKALDQVHPKKGVKTCYISVGQSKGVEPGQRFNVYARVEVAGERIRKMIGELKTKEVVSPTLTLCEVKEGGKEIQRFYEEEVELVVVSR